MDVLPGKRERSRDVAKLDLHDSLNDPLHNAPQLSLGNADDLISQLAGEEIDRLIGPDAPWQPQSAPELDFEPHTAPKAAAPSVDQLTAELDEVFERIRRDEPVQPPPQIDTSEPEPITLPEPVLAMRRFDEPIGPEVEPRRSLIQPLEQPPLPAILKPIAWLNAPVAQLQGRSRFAVNVVSLLSFAGSVAAFVYVIMLRRGL